MARTIVLLTTVLINKSSLTVHSTCLLEGLVLRPEQLKGALEFHNVSFAYPTRKDFPIFQNLNLSVPAGTVMAVVGSSGSGKSTLVSLLLRLYDPDSGQHWCLSASSFCSCESGFCINNVVNFSS